LPASDAAWTAAEMACWVLVVGLKESTAHFLLHRVLLGTIVPVMVVNVSKVESVPINSQS
jgi:hypothetical protein